ncbi:MAG: ATP-binding protein [Leptospiraceae bacterium]|nr:ATP-binding protein [Leptospiraceae bacterium]MCP5498867.1 ATP-binding protein [Leptospiraceae bacterium]
MEVDRLLKDKIQEIFSNFPILALIGARQVGKSTLIRQVFGDKLKTVVLDPIEDIGGARKDPDFFLQNHPPPLFLDEIQYVPELLPAIKRKVDKEKKKGMYILSGSQNFLLMKNISESLAGRVYIQELYSLCGKEEDQITNSPSFLSEWLQSEGQLDISHIQAIGSSVQTPQEPLLKRVWKGGLPGLLHISESLISGYWKSYIQTYIERDIRVLSRVESLQTFGNFVALLSALTAGEINYNELGRELGIDRKTAIAWSELLQASFQWVEIPAYSGNAIKRISSKKKGYFTDTGLISFFQKIPSHNILASHPFLGRMVETYLFMEIYKLVSPYGMKPNFYHFRTHSGSEIDLILEYGGTLFPIEFKTKTHPGKNDARSFSVFRDTFPKLKIARGLIVCSIEAPQIISENGMAIPYWIL